MEFLKLAAERYSGTQIQGAAGRAGKDRPAAACGAAGASGRNNQSWQIYVLQSAEALAAMDECTPCRFEAPLAFLICYDIARQAHVDSNEVNMGLVDSAIATTQIMLAAQELGLGSCWVCRFDAEKTCDLFSLPDEIEPACFLPLGYAEIGPSERHTQRMPLAAHVEYR